MFVFCFVNIYIYIYIHNTYMYVSQPFWSETASKHGLGAVKHLQIQSQLTNQFNYFKYVYYWVDPPTCVETNRYLIAWLTGLFVSWLG